MSKAVDSELIISVWSPTWMDGTGVAHLTHHILENDPEWRSIRTWVIPSSMVGARLQSVRSAGHLLGADGAQLEDSSIIVVSSELTKLIRDRRGPRLTCIVEHAASAIPCRPGLHSVDARFAVPEDVFQPKRGQKQNALVQGILSIFRSVCERIQPPWALCSTFGRGPSIAELYSKHESATMFGAAYFSNDVSDSVLTELQKLAPMRRTSAGREVIFSPMLGGGGFSDETKAHGVLRATMRQVSLSLVPQDVFSELSRA
jgi:hypothetical protein